MTGSINVRTSNGATDPTWECKVDGRVIPQEKPFPYFENNWDLCKWTANDVSDGQHRVEVNVRSNGQAFLFDRFQYVASPSANIQNSVVSVHYNDPAVTYGSGWGNLGDIGRMAPDGGATMTFKFYGMCLFLGARLCSESVRFGVHGLTSFPPCFFFLFSVFRMSRAYRDGSIMDRNDPCRVTSRIEYRGISH